MISPENFPFNNSLGAGRDLNEGDFTNENLSKSRAVQKRLNCNYFCFEPGAVKIVSDKLFNKDFN